VLFRRHVGASCAEDLASSRKETFKECGQRAAYGGKRGRGLSENLVPKTKRNEPIRDVICREEGKKFVGGCKSAKDSDRGEGTFWKRLHGLNRVGKIKGTILMVNSARSVTNPLRHSKRIGVSQGRTF